MDGKVGKPSRGKRPLVFLFRMASKRLFEADRTGHGRQVSNDYPKSALATNKPPSRSGDHK